MVDDTLAKALHDAMASCGKWPCRYAADWRQEARHLAAHPAMLARDAALVQQGRDEVAATVKAATDDAANVSQGGRVVTIRAVRAAVATAGASDLATIRAEALRDLADDLEAVYEPVCDRDSVVMYVRVRADRVAAEAGELQ